MDNVYLGPAHEQFRDQVVRFVAREVASDIAELGFEDCRIPAAKNGEALLSRGVPDGH